MTGIFAALAFFFGQRKRPKLCGLSLVFAFLTFLIAEINAGTTFTFQNHLTTEQILCWTVGFFFLLFAFFLIKEDHFSYAFMAFLFSVGACFCGLSGVQAILKTHLLQEVTTSLKGYGDKLDKFQTTVTDMRDDLRRQQSILASNQNALGTVEAQIQGAQIGVTNAQQGITNQFQKITVLQDRISAAQTNINDQEKKLSDVAYWVQNLYAEVTNETFSSTNVDNLAFFSTTNKSEIVALFRLGGAPIVGSIEGFFWDKNRLSEERIVMNWHRAGLNIGTVKLLDCDTNSLRLSFRYVIDTRQTNLYVRMPIPDKEVWVFPDSRWEIKNPPLD